MESDGLRPRGCGFNRLVSMAVGVDLQPLHRDSFEALFITHASHRTKHVPTHPTPTLNRGSFPEADTPTGTIMAESPAVTTSSGVSSLKTQAAVAATVVPPAPVKAPAAAVPPGK